MTKPLIPNLLLCLTLVPGPVCADPNSERETLAQGIDEALFLS